MVCVTQCISWWQGIQGGRAFKVPDPCAGEAGCRCTSFAPALHRQWRSSKPSCLFWRAQEYLPLGRFSEAEEQGFAALKAELRGSIQKGIDFVRKGS